MLSLWHKGYTAIPPPPLPIPVAGNFRKQMDIGWIQPLMVLLSCYWIEIQKSYL